MVNKIITGGTSEIDRKYFEQDGRKIRSIENDGDLYEALSPVLKRTLVIYGKDEWNYRLSRTEKFLDIIPDNYQCYMLTARSDSGKYANHEFAVRDDYEYFVFKYAEALRFFDELAEVTHTN